MTRGILARTITAGSPSPGYEHLSGGYRWRKIPGWTPGDPRFHEAETRRPGPPPGSPNSSEAKAARLATFCEAREAGKSVREAGRIANVADKTARSYERERKQQRAESRDG